MGQPAAGTKTPSAGASLVHRITGSKELGILLVLIGMVAFIGFFNPSFISVDSLSNVAQRAAWYGIIALGIVFLLSMGEIDLSVGALYAVSINMAAIMMSDWGWDPWLAAAAGVVIGLLLGAFNGVMANLLGLPAIIITLGTLSLFRGMALIISGGRFVYGIPREHAFFQFFGSEPLGVPMVIWVFALLTIILSVVYRSTRYGYLIRAIGSNSRAARLSGIPIPRMRLITLTLMGGLCGISAMMTLAFFSTADPNLGQGYELLAIAAAIIGGTALSGGRGTVLGAAVGAVVIAVIASGITRFGISANFSTFVTGAMILLAVAVDALIRRRQERRRSLT
ncbi:MAG: ABC transporter permease [Chloroflexota bacterium]